MSSKTIFRGFIITLVGLLTGCLINLLTDMETLLGLDTLFKLRGARQPPKEVVVVAMDETSDKNLNLGWDFPDWRKYHAQLIKELQRQESALIIFDLQFIAEQPAHDPAFAKAIQSAGNVLITGCLQTQNDARDECSTSHKDPPIQSDATDQEVLNENLAASRLVHPNALIQSAALGHAPFVLSNDAENPVIREVWTFIDKHSEIPTLPVLAWIHYLNHEKLLPDTLKLAPPISEWLSLQRRKCREGLGNEPTESVQKYGLVKRIDDIICGEDSRYLDFYGPPKTIRMESYSDVYEGKVGDLKEKVVFVGKANRYRLPGLKDYFQTSLTSKQSGRMAGVEIMATQFANLLEGRFVEPYPPLPILSAFGLAAAGLLVQFPGLTGLTLSILAGVIYAFSVQWCFNRSGLWLPVAVPLLVQLPLSGFMSLIWTYFDQKQKIKEITAENKRLIKDFIDEFKTSSVKSRVSVGLQKAQAKPVFGICLATDVKGYTTIAEANPADLVYANLEEYFELLCAPVSARGGEIANITGDSLMAIWRDLPDDKQRKLACIATLEMEEAVERFSKRSALGAFPTRIGLHQGRFTLGSFLAGNPGTSNPVGDTVNTASRIEGLNKKLGTKILASSAIAENSSGIFFRPIGEFQLAGRAEIISLVEIVGVESDIAPDKTVLYKRFANGLKLFQQGQWENALLAFKGLLETQIHDGPTRYYYDQACAFKENPPQSWGGFITLDSK